MEDFRNLIVIGASAGGMTAIKTLLAGIEPSLDAAVVVVLHVSRESDCEFIASNLEKYSPLICAVATDGVVIERNHLYLAPPNHHLMVKEGRLQINQGPHENKYRPSIDVLFRSAAVAYGNRAIGVILTGMLDDGTSGMWAIKEAGGICIIQDPNEAQFGDMPRSVLNRITVDYKETVAKIPAIINQLMQEPLPALKTVPVSLKIEANITERMMSEINDLKEIADRSDFVCPDCGGGLWAVKNDPVKRYRCHTGHVYTERLLNELQDDRIEESIWVSIRMLEEKANMLLLMAGRTEKNGSPIQGNAYKKRIAETKLHIKRLKSLLPGLGDNPESA